MILDNFRVAATNVFWKVLERERIWEKEREGKEEDEQ
jgi:hypothetical protein